MSNATRDISDLGSSAADKEKAPIRIIFPNHLELVCFNLKI
jgi:hypothetical protein